VFKWKNILVFPQDGMDWSCMDKRQMWAEQGRPAWLKAMVGLARDALGPSVANWATSLDNIFQGRIFKK
jgi:hypothetical protein